MEIIFDKLYRYDRKVPSYIAIPVKEGELKSLDRVQILQNGKAVPIQKKVTSRYADGSIRYLLLRFLADLHGNKREILECDFHSDKKPEQLELHCERAADGFVIRNRFLTVALQNGTEHLFSTVKAGEKFYHAEQFVGPYLKDGDGKEYQMVFGDWNIVEEGAVYIRIGCKGIAVPKGSSKDSLEDNLEEHLENKKPEESYKEEQIRLKEEAITFVCNLEFYAESQDIEISFRLINSTEKLLDIAALGFVLLSENGVGQDFDFSLSSRNQDNRDHNKNNEDRDHWNQDNDKTDSTGCGDQNGSFYQNGIFEITGIKELPMIEAEIGTDTVRTCVGRSNYKTKFWIGRDGKAVDAVIDAESLIHEANEHYAEVFYGTFFADRTEADGGVSATIYQAQQNFPKAVKADQNGIFIMLVPEQVNHVEMESGMSREQKFLLHFHTAEESLKEIDHQSLMYQMRDRPYIRPEVFQKAGVMPDIFLEPKQQKAEVEIALIGKCDGHGRSYGMMCWGDTPDMNYTTQGRGKGMLVWGNNEYDFPHACAMQYARTGERRFMDYMLVAAQHWMDVDVCHYSKNPLLIGGQWEHTRRHVKDGVMVCSHEWVEGLLDYYHFTGDERGFQTAIGIGENVLVLLETPMYQTAGESNARETGWALRTLVALYVETHEKRWLEKCEWIVQQFMVWKEEYGEWLAPYTDNTLVRVGFMISVAIGSLMRYYRIAPSEELKRLLLGAVDDLVENAMLPCGLFYYKELPSLKRLGTNGLLLEALTIAYELSGDATYLSYGKMTFERAIHEAIPATGGGKRYVEDAVLTNGGATKNFAQIFLPLTLYYTALVKEGLI